MTETADKAERPEWVWVTADHLGYLEALDSLGSVNILEGVAWLQAKFGIDRGKAAAIFVYWLELQAVG